MGEAKRKQKWKEARMHQRKRTWKQLGKAVLMFLAIITVVPIAVIGAYETYRNG